MRFCFVSIKKWNFGFNLVYFIIESKQNIVKQLTLDPGICWDTCGFRKVRLWKTEVSGLPSLDIFQRLGSYPPCILDCKSWFLGWPLRTFLSRSVLLSWSFVLYPASSSPAEQTLLGRINEAGKIGKSNVPRGKELGEDTPLTKISWNHISSI